MNGKIGNYLHISFFLPKINFKLGFLNGTKYTKGFTVKSKPLPALDPSHPVALPTCESESRSIVFNSLRPHGLYIPWNSLGQNTEVGSFSLLQGIFPTQGLNPGLPHCRQIFYQLSHKGSPRLLEWVAHPFSRDLSDPEIKPGSHALQADSLPTELSPVLFLMHMPRDSTNK